MLRDRDGFMWFGTQDGLNLFDGKKFRVFQNQPGDSNSLSNNYIVSICEDEEGFLWVGTMTGGLNRFDKHTEQFKTFIHHEKSNSISENTVWAVLSDGEGNIWMGTSKGLNRFHKQSSRFTSYRHISNDSLSITTDMVVSLYMDKRRRLWIGTVEGLCMMDRSKGIFNRFRNPNENESPGANLVWSVSETPQGEITTGTNNGVYQLDLNLGKYKRILGSPKEAQIVAWSVNSNQQGIIWVGSEKGLYRIQMPGLHTDSFIHEPSDPYSIVNNNIWCLLNDPSGFLWTGTNNGICKTKISTAHFQWMNNDPGQALKLSSPKVMAVLEDKEGRLWIGTDGGGLNCVNRERNKIAVYNASNSGMRNDNVWALAEDQEGNIYIGNYQGGLHLLNRKTNIIQAFQYNSGNEYSLSNPRILSLLVGHDGMVWIGTRGGGLNRLDPKTGKFTVFLDSPKDPSGFPANTVLSLAEDSKGQIWAGTQEGGLALFKPETGKFQTFRHKSGDEFSISDNNIWAIEFDKKGRMWVGTQGGLNYTDQPGEEMVFRYFTTRDGLRSNTILGIQEDREGNIWMSNFSGLAKLDMKTFELSKDSHPPVGESSFFHPLFSLFDTDHGLQGLEYNQGSSHRGHSGMMYFGGNNGLNYFSEKDVKVNNYRPPIVITGIKVFNKEVSIRPGEGHKRNSSARMTMQGTNYVLPEKVTYLKELIMTYRETVISFEFSSLDFTNPHKNQYAYKMINFDEDWNFVGTQNTATYTNLDPGEYTLLIRGSNSDGIWNPEETSLKIVIVPPFYKTAWFIILASSLILLISFFVLRSVFIKQRRKVQKEKEFIELQLKTIKSQIDPHFAFNAINTIAGFIYSEQPDITYDYFTRFARMIRNILEDNEKISRSLNEEIEFVRNYLELQKMRFKEKFEYSITIAENIPGNTQVPKMIIQSYAENAIKHGLMHRVSDGKLLIDIKNVNSRLHVIIEDNGVGREKAAQLQPDTTKRGFRIMEQIIDLYRKLYHTDINQVIEDLSDENGNPRGTRVILTIFLLEKADRKMKFNFRKMFSWYGK